MRIRYLYFYALFLAVIGMLWRTSRHYDARLQEMYSRPDPNGSHVSVAAAEAELKLSYATQRDLVTMVHRMHGLTTQTAIYAALLALPLLYFAMRPVNAQPISTRNRDS